MKIVLLTGEEECQKCRQSKEILARIAERSPIVEIEVLRSTDPGAAEYGIVMTPTVIVDNTIIASGRAPNERKLEAFLKAHAGEGGPA